jgi:protein tyrosine phosphatase (PTP) superfamily phosphohydrolase (DUF442 family)
MVSKTGMTFIQIPIAGADDLTKEKVQAVADAIEQSNGKNTLIHCASGNRVGAVMALKAAWIDGLGAEAAISVGESYGLTSLKAQLADQLKH